MKTPSGSLERLARALASLPCALLMLALTCAPVTLQPRDSAADALAGHRAEQRVLMGETDALRRPLFYDPVAFESPVVGVPCDHRPHAIAGTGYVVLLETAAAPVRRLRFFAAPGEATSLAQARELARTFAKSRLSDAKLNEIGARSFGWCR